MIAAAIFARRVFEIEATEDHQKGLVSGEAFYAHRGYVTGAVFSAVASLETTINERFRYTPANTPESRSLRTE
jgi:hypothetical protein